MTVLSKSRKSFENILYCKYMYFIYEFLHECHSDEIHASIQAAMDDKTLDVDGNGSVTALGDGLMIIRKLFGAAFAGDALTDKAISNNATRTTNEIHEYISNLMDVGPSV